MALGANRRDVLRLVPGGGLKMAALGVVAGAGIAFGFARVAGRLLFGVSPYDPLTYAGLATVLLGLAVAGGVSPSAPRDRLQSDGVSPQLTPCSAAL